MPLLLVLALALSDLQRAQQLAWDKQFAASEALYREILGEDPASHEARLGLARVVLWQKRYPEAIALFRDIDGIDALEGRATAEYWSGDLRAAARNFRRVLAAEPRRETARKALDEILATARPMQRISVDAASDDQPLDAVRADVAATFFSDPLTRWTATFGAYRLDAGRIGERSGTLVALENETRFQRITLGARLGLFTFPDGVRRPVGGITARYRALTFRIDRREEIASAASLRTHASSTTSALRWDHDRSWLASAEISHRRYSDGNEGRAATAWAVAPLRRGDWTFWSGGSAAFRDTDESRFGITAVSSMPESGAFRYAYRGEYDPYWTPDRLREVRGVVALERRFSRASVKLHADAGRAWDRGRAFGPDFGPAPLPASPYAVEFDRTYSPWRTGLSASVDLAPSLRIEAGVDHAVTVDYRTTSVHAALVRRR